MGLGIVLIFWAVVGVISAMVGALAMGGVTHFLTRRAAAGNRKLTIAALVFPFACLGWAASVFVLQAVINEAVLHRDLGLGDTSHAPLSNGYQIMMIDDTEQGWVYNPRTQGSGGAVGEQEDAIAGVRRLQVAGRYILGGSDSNSFAHFGDQNQEIDSYFVLDTQTGKRTQLQSYDDLKRKSHELNINLDLQPIYEVYRKFRFGLFDLFVGLLLFIPPAVGFVLLTIRVRRLMRPASKTVPIA